MGQFLNERWFIIVNPSAAYGQVARIWPELQPLIAARLPNVTVRQTQYPGHAVQLVEEAVAAGFRHIISVGGDGTNHEVANGILQQQVVSAKEIFYSLLPLGTGNDWARMYGIPDRLGPWLDMLEEGYYCHQEAGLVKYRENGQQKQRYFVNVAGMAYDAFVVRFGAGHRAWMRNRFFYLLLILRCLFKYRLRPGILHVDGQVVRQRFYTINVGICRYSGGGMQLVPQALPDDGLLALTYAGPVTKLGVLLNTWRFYNGSIGRHPKIHTTQATHILVEAPPGEAPILLEADGEYLGESPAEFTILENALTVIMPQKENKKVTSGKKAVKKGPVNQK